MRTALLTNSAVGVAAGTANPASNTESATANATTAQNAAQAAQAAASSNSKVLAAERGVAVEKRPEENFDTQKNDTEEEGAGPFAKRTKDEKDRSKLLAVA